MIAYQLLNKFWQSQGAVGKRRGGFERNEFLPACSGWGGKCFRNSALAEYQNRKNFVSLIEKIICMIRISFYAALADWASSTQLSCQSSRRRVNQHSKRCQGRVESGLRALGCLPDAVRSAKSKGNHPDLPAHQSESHEKYSPPVSAAIKSS